MKRILIGSTALALAIPGVAGAAKKPDAPKSKPKPAACEPTTHGYSATGSYVSGTLTQTKGADTATRGDDRYSGDLVVDVKKANHKGTKGEQTVTLTDARVKFHPRKDTELAAGDRVKLQGTVTRLAKKCDTTGFVPTVTVRKADIKAKRS